MTTIIYHKKSRTVTADTQVTTGNLITKRNKVSYVGNAIIATSGEVGMGVQLIEWYKLGADPAQFPSIVGDKSVLLVVRPCADDPTELEALYYFQAPYPEAIEEEVFAMGSGKELAYMALLCGKTPREAIVLCSQLDAYTNNICTQHTLT